MDFHKIARQKRTENKFTPIRKQAMHFFCKSTEIRKPLHDRSGNDKISNAYCRPEIQLLGISDYEIRPTGKFRRGHIHNTGTYIIKIKPAIIQTGQQSAEISTPAAYFQYHRIMTADIYHFHELIDYHVLRRSSPVVNGQSP